MPENRLGDLVTDLAALERLGRMLGFMVFLSEVDNGY